MNDTSIEGDNALHIAFKNGWTHIAKYFIDDHIFDKNVRHKDGSTAIHFSCQNMFSHQLIHVRYLIDELGFDCNSLIFYGQSPLYFACTYGSLEVVQYLLENQQIDINEKIRKDGNTALHLAVFYLRIDIIKYLLSHGANKQATNNYGETPLDIINKYPALLHIDSKIESLIL